MLPKVIKYVHMNYIGLMDCNNFFVSCERLFRPDLWRKPVAVLSSNDGCIVARSQEVKDLGIPMGIPYFQVKDMCQKENITLFSSNFKLYRDISDRVMCALKEEFDVCEVYSVDEAFFEIPDTVTEKELLDIRARIIKKTGIPVSFGVASTKTIAKAASTYAKKGNGVCIFTNEIWQKKTSDISCGTVWGIGRKTTESLRTDNVNTVADLLSKDFTFIRDRYGVMGERMFFEVSGVSVYGVGNTKEAEHQSLSSTRSFKNVVMELSALESALAYHVSHVAEKLRSSDREASYIRIIAAPSRFGDFAIRQTSLDLHLESPTADTNKLIHEAIILLKRLYQTDVPYKKAGVVLGGIVSKRAHTYSLFEDRSTHEEDSLNTTIDALNSRFGSGMVRSGIIQNEQKWKESALLRSPQYTTNWSEIVTVKTSTRSIL